MKQLEFSLFVSTPSTVPLSRRSPGAGTAVSMRDGAWARRRFLHSTGLRWYQVREWERDGGGPITLSMSNMPKVRFPGGTSRVYLDGSGFTVLLKYGRWPWDAMDHRRRARLAVLGLGRMRLGWVCIQDWMCEPDVLRKTGLTVAEHQRRTVRSYLDLCDLDPSIPWLPVVQGWTLDDYLACVEMYRAAGIDLTEFERVGVGSVCKRQDTPEGIRIIVTLLRMGINVHAFGYTAAGLKKLAAILNDEEWSRLESDSAAWSQKARSGKGILLPGHYHGQKTKNCANCVKWARVRRGQIISSLDAIRDRRLADSLLEAA